MADPRRTDPPVIEETATEARAGSTPGVTRNVLFWGTTWWWSFLSWSSWSGAP